MEKIYPNSSLTFLGTRAEMSTTTPASSGSTWYDPFTGVSYLRYGTTWYYYDGVQYGTDAERLALALTTADRGFKFNALDVAKVYVWGGATWLEA